MYDYKTTIPTTDIPVVVEYTVGRNSIRVYGLWVEGEDASGLYVKMGGQFINLENFFQKELEEKHDELYEAHLLGIAEDRYED